MRKMLFILFAFRVFSLTAQNELPTGQIEVIKDFEVRLTETKKIRLVPQPLLLDSTVRSYDYALLTPSPAIDYLTPEIKPLAITAERKPAYYPFFVKAGYGSPNSLLALLSYDHVQNESFQWGLDVNHLSANNKKIQLQKFADSRGRINASYLLHQSVRLDGYVDGHFETHYFYGADPIPSNPESLKRTFNRYDAHFKLSKEYSPETSFRYNAFLQYLADKDNLGSTESAIRLGGEIGSALGQQEYPLGIKVSADASKLKHTEEHSINNYLIEPYFDYFIKNMKLHLGATALFHENQNELLPAVELSLNVMNNRMTLRAGWTGEVVKNNFHSLSSYNPYINTRLGGINNMVSRRIYAGIKGTASALSYELTGGYTKFQQMAFFLQNEDREEQFDPIYDSGSYVGIEGAVRYEVLKYVVLHVQVWDRIYSPDNEEKPWHKPSFGLDGAITYTGSTDDYHISFLFHGENGLPYRTVGGTVDNLEPLIDLNLHADYFISKSIGAFVEINNLLGNNRERWVNYPSYGFNAKGGILVRLP